MCPRDQHAVSQQIAGDPCGRTTRVRRGANLKGSDGHRLDQLDVEPGQLPGRIIDSDLGQVSKERARRTTMLGAFVPRPTRQDRGMPETVLFGEHCGGQRKFFDR